MVQFRLYKLHIKFDCKFPMNYLDIARSTLLEPTHLEENDLDQLVGQLSGQKIDHADIYFQYSRHESWLLEEGIVKSGSYGIDKGVGLRAVSGERTGFAACSDLSLPALKDAANSVRAIAERSAKDGSLSIKRHTAEVPTLYQPDNPLSSLTDDEKVRLLEKVEQEARRLDPRVKEVNVTLAGVHDVVMVMRSDGITRADVRPLVRLNVTVVAEHNGRRETATSGGGSRDTYGFLTRRDRALEYAREAVRQVQVQLEAEDAPAGTMVVVLGPGWPGVLLHEAIGHGLEGDFNRKGTSAFSNRIGEKVASELCTVVDDGTLPNRRGSLSVDDEGTLTQRTVLIERGILKGYMQDLTNARLMNQSPTGNGRRQSYEHLPMVRMTNTYMLPGPHTQEEIIRSVDKGLYASNFAGGQVDITSGKFVFSASEAYYIENGRITRPVKGATLIGNGPDVLTKVTMVGDDFQLDSGVGTCGKEGQWVPVGVGQPTLRVDGLTVGGVVV